MATIYTEVEVEVDLAEFDTSDLIEELESRDVVYRQGNDVILDQIYMAKIRGQDYTKLVDDLIYNALGKIV